MTYAERVVLCRLHFYIFKLTSIISTIGGFEAMAAMLPILAAREAQYK
jgi:hypothetical protein